MMSLRNLRPVVAACVILILTHFVQSRAVVYSLGPVTLIPKSPVPYGADSVLSVFVFASGEPTFLYEPTEVGRTGNVFQIKIYPGHPEVVKAVEGGFKETVTIGPLTLGNYNYKVELHLRPGDTLGEIREAEGNFVVAPQLQASRSGNTLTLRWPSGATDYVLQVASKLSSQTSTHWANVQTPPSVVGTEFILSQPIMTGATYFRLKAID